MTYASGEPEIFFPHIFSPSTTVRINPDSELDKT